MSTQRAAGNVSEGHEVFESSEFSDQAIVKQLMSLEHQMLLSEHGDWLEKLGPCTVSMARHLESARTKSEARRVLASYLESNQTLNKDVCEVLWDNSESVLDALRIVAESYLSRGGRGLPSWGMSSTGDAGISVPETILIGESGTIYTCKRFLAKGSAGIIYAGTKQGSTKEDVAIKRVYPTQAESALNEYRIATAVRGARSCLAYVDLVATPNEEVADRMDYWLILPLVMKSPKYGVDLREYIVKGFFQDPSNISHSRDIVLQLLEGLEDASRRGVIMRDVKPDNVLIESTSEGSYTARWADFGLAAYLGSNIDGNGLRRVTKTSALSTRRITDDLVGWWYDACKLVPRPKWQARRPPERAFQDPRTTNGAHAFDLYMCGIILVCMAVGVDIPHLDQPEAKKLFEEALGLVLEKDFLKTFELGQSLLACPHAYKPHFERTWGPMFGSRLFDECRLMLAKDPSQRPRPAAVVERLKATKEY